MGAKRWILVGVLAAFTGACGAGGGVASGSTGTTATARPRPSFATYPPNFSVGPLPTVTVSTPAPPSGPGQYKAGDTVTVTTDGAPWAEITVSRVKVVKRYEGPYNLDDVPAKGNVYIQAFVTYVALDNGVDYGSFDWQVFVGEEAADDFTYVSNGPTPELSSGTLPKGRKASGWVVYEVAATGPVRMSYGGGSFSNEAPVFEVLIRAK